MVKEHFLNASVEKQLGNFVQQLKRQSSQQLSLIIVIHVSEEAFMFSRYLL